LKLKINCNLGEAPVLAQHGRRQYQNAFLSRDTYFTIRVPDAPSEKQADWGRFITKKLNKPLKRSLQYFEYQRSKWSAVLSHGYAPGIFYDRCKVTPDFVALEDFRVPTDSLCDLSNLYWFAVRKNYTEGELAKKVWGKYAMKGWNKKRIQEILHTVHDYNWEAIEAKWTDQPEKLAEIVKQNGGFYAGDAVPTIPLFHFYFLDDSGKRPEWRLRVVPDTQTLSVPTTEFLFENGKYCMATDIRHILQMQYGDLNNKPPFMIHSIRALGFLLMEPIYHSNLLDCRFLQHVHEHMNAWIRVGDVQGKARAQKIDLFHDGIVPDGVSIVPQTERHQIDPNIIEMAKKRMEAIKQQASVSYTQDSEPGGKENETATAVMARVSQVNAMMSGLLATARQYEQFACEEICRRFCLRNSDDVEARDFQKACREFGIPSVYLNVEMWEVEVDMPLGNGNPTMEMAQANLLMQNINSFDGTAQSEIKHEWLVAVTGDPRKAARWQPIGKQLGVTNAQEHAELAFSTLMLGVPVQVKEGLSLSEQIETILGLMSGVIARIEKTGNVARQDEIIGLQNCAEYLSGKQDGNNQTPGLIQRLEADPNNKQQAKQFSQILGKLMNTVKGFEQRLMEQQKKAAIQNGENGQSEMALAQAKAQATMLQAGAKAKVTETGARQKLQHKDAAFVKEQQRRDLQTLKEERRKDAAAFGDIQREHVKTKADIQNQRYTTFNKPSKDE